MSQNLYTTVVEHHSYRLKINIKGLMRLHSDNWLAISIANNPVQHDHTKYVEIDWRFIKEKTNHIPYVPL